ncbi:MAG: hypothetical protein F4Y54_02540 [Dehalococcoidia bacterium]|nr:hypothetical protein [Dehalococcoidia bacterium]
MRQGQSEESVTGEARRGERHQTLTLTRAQFSHLKTPTWADYPMDMLVAKVQSRLAAQLFPDILGGMQAVMAHGQRLDITRDVAPDADPVTGEIVEGEVVEGLPEAAPAPPPEPPPDDARLCVACDEPLAHNEQEVCARCGADPDDDLRVGDDLPPGYDEGDPVDDEPAAEVDEPAASNDTGDTTVPALRKRHKGDKHAALTAADFMAVSRMVQAFDFPEGMGAVRLIRGWPTTDDGRPKPINKEAVTEWCVTYAAPGQGLDMIAHELTILQANR